MGIRVKVGHLGKQKLFKVELNAILCVPSEHACMYGLMVQSV